jgi:predicted AlkP superfamily phosphohydrolase/phosphomutase
MRFLHIGMDGMNYPLLRKFMAEGCLPTFERLIARGTINRLMPSIAAWTPTNWAAQITGAHPGIHGLGGWTRHRKTDPMSIAPIESWESRDWHGETVWQVAEDAGLKCLITHYPVGVWPSPIQDGYVVAPGFRYPPYVIADAGEYYASAAVQTQGARDDRLRVRSVDEVEEGGPPGSIPVSLRPAQGWRDEAGDSWEGELPIRLMGGGERKVHLLVRSDDLEKAWVYADKSDAQPLAELTLGQWTRFAVLNLDGLEGSVRFRLLSISPGPTLHLCRSQIYATRGFTYPESLAEELVREVGPFFVKFTVYPRAQAELEAFLDDVGYQGHWQARVARYVQEQYGWDLHFCHWHIFDNINHPTVNAMDPDGPDYDLEIGAWHTEAQRRAYRIADEVLAEFLTLADADTHVMVVSDHAMPPAHRWADINVRLAECGLMAFDPVTREIDLQKSATYTWPGRGAEVFVNLAGREPTGIVPPEKYGTVQDQILDALFDWRDPGTGKRVMALALRLQDAQIIGFWGADNGDVICVFNHGMGWGPPIGGGSVGPGRGALHGSQLPTYETEHFTTMGMMILAGPGVKQGGYERDWRRWGLIREVDVAPTICHLAGLRPPAQNQGVIPYDLLE